MTSGRDPPPVMTSGLQSPFSHTFHHSIQAISGNCKGEDYVSWNMRKQAERRGLNAQGHINSHFAHNHQPFQRPYNGAFTHALSNDRYFHFASKAIIICSVCCEKHTVSVTKARPESGAKMCSQSIIKHNNNARFWAGICFRCVGRVCAHLFR
jgi:hypothetical protein